MCSSDLELVGGTCTRLLVATSVGVYVEEPSCMLEVDALELSLAAGGTQDHTVSAGVASAGYLYWLAGSGSGTSPGFVIDGVNLPLNLDAYFLAALTFANSPLMPGAVGFLDTGGQASAPALVVPPGANPSLAGLTLHHAAAIVDLFGTGLVTTATNAQPLTLVP